MTSDLGISVFLAEVMDPQCPSSTLVNYSHGSGCAIQPSVALRKALLEAAQIRLTYISGARDDLLPSDYGVRFNNVVAHRLAFLNGQHNSEAFPAPIAMNPSSIDDENSFLLRRLRAHGKRVLAVDLTQPGSCVHVVKVIIPGLEDDIGGIECEPGTRALRKRFACRVGQLSWAA